MIEVFLHWCAAASSWLLCILYCIRTGQMKGHIQRRSEAGGRATLVVLFAVLATGFINRASAGDPFQWFHVLLLCTMIVACGFYLRLVLTPDRGRPTKVLDPEGLIMSTLVPPPVPQVAVVAESKWGKAFWSDYLERAGSTLLYALITLIPTLTLDVPAEVLWTTLGIPVVLVLLKGLLANLKADNATGASLLPSGSPGPVLTNDAPVPVDELPAAA